MKEKKEMSPYIVERVTVFLFGILIFGLSIASILKPVKTFSENENRYLAEKPIFSIENLLNGEYTSEYETFITDQFVLRDQWIKIKTQTERMMLKQDINNVFFGKDNYLIERHKEEDIDKGQLKKNKKRIVEFIKKFEEKLGIGAVKFMLVPTASAVLYDKLPPFAPQYNQDKLIDSIYSQLSEQSVIDVRETLRIHKEEDIYYKTDHHWTANGAYYAYTIWAKAMGITPLQKEEFQIEKVSDSFYGTIYSKVNTKVEADEIYLYKPIKESKYKVTYNMGELITDTLYDLEKLEEKDKYAVYLRGNNAVVQIDSELKNGKSLLVIKDSFAHTFVPFLANHYEHIYMIDFRYFNAGVESYIEQNKITDILVLYNTINFAKDKHTGNFIR